MARGQPEYVATLVLRERLQDQDFDDASVLPPCFGCEQEAIQQGERLRSRTSLRK